MVAVLCVCSREAIKLGFGQADMLSDDSATVFPRARRKSLHHTAPDDLGKTALARPGVLADQCVGVMAGRPAPREHVSVHLPPFFGCALAVSIWPISSVWSCPDGRTCKSLPDLSV